MSPMMFLFILPPWVLLVSVLQVPAVVVDQLLQRLLDGLGQGRVGALGIPRPGLPAGDVAGEFLLRGALPGGAAYVLACRRVLHLQVDAHVRGVGLALG